MKGGELLHVLDLLKGSLRYGVHVLDQTSVKYGMERDRCVT